MFPSVNCRFVELPSIRLHLAEAGSGPLVVLLHGFPDFWYAWRHQLAPLAAAGWHAVAPDMRGYNLSEKPFGFHAYRLDQLADDVAELIEALGERDAALIGHDWGGIVAWHTVLRHPARVRQLAIVNAPPPLPLLAAPPPPDQFFRSWYVGAFQLPLLPEAVLSVGHFAMLKRAMQADVENPAALTAADLRAYEAAWSRPGALTAMLNYYRALAWYGPGDSARATAGDRRVTLPVQVVWGERDPHLATDLARLNPARVPHAELAQLPLAGHWAHWDEPARVMALWQDFLR